MKRLRNQSGMIDIILIAVVFIAAAALGGYVYYQQQQAKKADTAAGTGVTVASHPKAKATTATPAVTYLTITQWNVKLPLTSAITDLSYSYTSSQDSVSFASSSLTTLDKACALSSTYSPLGHIVRST